MAEAEELQEHTEPEEVFPTTVPEEKLDEARREHTLRRLFDFGKVLKSRVPKPELQASVIIQNKAHEHCRNGKEAMEKSEFERAVSCFSKTIHLQPDQVQHLPLD